MSPAAEGARGNIQNKGLGRVDDDGADVVRMGLERRDLLARVVVIDAQLEVVRAANDPVLARNEAASADGHFAELEALDDLLRLVGPDVSRAAIETREDPWLLRVKVDGLGALAACEQLPLDVQTHLGKRTRHARTRWFDGGASRIR